MSKIVQLLSLSFAFAVGSTAAFAGQGAQRMLYTVPNSTFIEKTSGDSGVVTINDASGSTVTLQASINSARNANPSSIIIIRLLSGATYWVNNNSSGLVLGSQECLVGSGATIQATNSAVTNSLVLISAGSTNVSVAGGTLNGNGANIYGIFSPANSARVNIDKVTVQNCGQDCIQLNGNGSGTFDNEMTVTRCDLSGSPSHSGISIWNATQTTCVDNFCHSNSVGIWLGNCGYANIANNVCIANSTGINCNSGSDNYVVNNTCNFNGTGIYVGGSGNMIVSDLFASNSVAGINSSGSGNIFSDNLFSSGNGVNFSSNGSGDDVVAYKGALSASGQNYFYPPLTDNQHNTTIVNGKSRYDLTDNSTGPIDNVQTEYNAAVSANPGDVIVLHLNGTYTVGSNPLTLSSDTCILLGGKIQMSSSSTSEAIYASGASYISISGGTIDGGTTTSSGAGHDAIYFTGCSMFQIDGMLLQNFGTSGTRVGGSDVVRIDHGSTPRIFTRNTILNGSARGFWLATGGVRDIVSDNTVTGVQMDGVDCDESTYASVIKNNYLANNTRYGVFLEQSASDNLVIGNVCNYNSSYDIGCYNNSATPRGSTAYNSVICNALLGGNGLRNGSTGTNVVTSSDNFFFNNTLMSANIQSQLYGSQNYYSQNYMGNSSLSTSGAEVFFNSTDVTNMYVQASNNGLAVLVTNASTASTAAVITGQPSGLGNDQWALIPTDGGYFQIENKKSGLDMNVNGASLNAGALIIQYPFGSGQNDQWMPVSAGNGLYNFINRLSGLYLDVPSVAAGTQLDQQPPSGGANQQFNLTLTITTGTSQIPFSMSASPASQTVIAGSNTTFTATVSTNNNFTNIVTFAVSGLPANVGSSFSPPSLGANGNSTLTLTTSNNTAPGSYALTITGSGDGITNTAAVNLVVVSGTAALPGTLVWTNGAGNLNWSSLFNWTNITAGGYGPPGISNSLIFTNYSVASASALTAPGSGVVIPANINSSVNTSFSVIGLTDFANSINTSPVYHNLGIAGGATLTTGDIQVGGFTSILLGDNNTVNLTVSGAGATLVETNGGVTVSADAANGPANNALLDLSGLDNFSMNGTQIRLGVEGGGSFHHASGVMYLAKTNVLTLSSSGYADGGAGSPDGGNPALTLGHNKSALGNGAQLYLGIANTISMDYATIGRGDANDLLEFNPAFLAQNPSVTIQGTNGAGTRVGVYAVGDDSAGEGGSTSNTNDFSGGTVNALINYLCVGRGRDGANDTTTCNGFLTFNVGSINANTLAIGFLYPSGSNTVANGTVNVNGGTLTVVTNITLASRPNTGGSGSTSGTLNINGGMVQATNIAGGGGLSIINVNSGILDLQFGNPFAGTITNVSTLNLGVIGAGSSALLENAARISVSNTITIAANGTLAGNTFVTAPALIVNGTISPGSGGSAQSVGAITNSGAMTFGVGGNFVVAVQNANGVPVAGWDFLQTGGQLNVQATNTNPFVIQLQSFDPNGSGEVTNFNADTNYDWTIAIAGGGITNFSANKFSMDTSQFQNDLEGGYFYIRTNSNSLILSFTNNHPPMATNYVLYQTPNGVAIPISNLASNWSDPDGDPVVLNDVNDTSTNGVAVGFDSHFIYYTNSAAVADAIFYTVADVRTNPPAIYRPGDTQRTATGEIILLTPPIFNGANLSGTNLVFSGTGGIPGTYYFVLSATNIALPLNQWTPVLTNTFDGSGNFNFTNNPDWNLSQQFYRLRF